MTQAGGEHAPNPDIRVPRARTTDLVMTESGGDLLVYDLRAHHIHHLDAVSASVWHHCDGQRGSREIARSVARDIGVAVDMETVSIALAQLADAELLDGPLRADMRIRIPRRELLRRAAKSGAAVVPAVVSITAPLASASASGGCTMLATGLPIDQSACNGSSRVGLCCRRSNLPYEGVCRQIGTSYSCVPLDD